MRESDGDRSGDDRGQRECGDPSGSEPRVHGLLRAWLLLLLAGRENHGYELVRQLAEELPEEMVPDPGVVYRMLRKLEEKGAVVSTLRPGGGGPARRVYSLTEVGRSRLKEWRSTAQARIDLLHRFLTRLSMLSEGSE